MKVDGELDRKNKWDQRKKEIVKQMRKIDEIADLLQDFVDERKENVAPRIAGH